MTTLTAKIILITGAGRGVGQALAEICAARGAKLALNDLNPLGLEQTVGRVRAAGGLVNDYAFDLTKLLPVVALVQQVLDDFGRIDVLVNAEAVQPGDRIFEMDEWDFHRTLDVNLTAPFFLIQRVGQVMQQQGGGTILNVGGNNQQGGAAYRASMAALEALSQAAADELSPHGIRIFHVPPDPVAMVSLLERV